MDYVRAFLAFLQALPKIIGFVEKQQELADDKAVEEKVDEDKAKIDKAFEGDDAKALNDIFSKR